MNTELLREEIKLAKKRIAEDKKFIAETGQKIAEHLCPFEVGDTVVSFRGEKHIVASIHYSFRLGYGFDIFKIKNDGTPYKNSQYAYNIDEYMKASD